MRYLQAASVTLTIVSCASTPAEHTRDQASSHLRQLTDHPADEYNCTVSHDGTRVAFARLDGEGYNVFVIPLAGGDATQLAPELSGDFHNAWSPNDSLIVFDAVDPATGSNDLWVTPAEGGDVTHLTNHVASNESLPDWSPDGLQVAFFSMRTGGGDLCVMPATGASSSTRLTTAPETELGPRWSPDGCRIAFTANFGGNWEVMVMPAEGGTPTRLTTRPGWDMVCGWSLDGSYILYVSDQGGDKGIWRIPAEGGTPEVVLDQPGEENSASYLPDGSGLLFAADYAGNFDLYIAY